MTKRLNPSQRLWLLFVLVFLASTGSFMAVVWPQRDPAIVADLRSADCSEWRQLPDGVVPDVYPEPGQPCYAMRSLLFREHVSVRSEVDYDGYLARQRVRTALNCLGVWAGFSIAVYVLGWTSGWVTRTLGRQREQKAG